MNFLVKLAQLLIKGGKVAMPYAQGISALTPTKKDDAIVARASDTLTQLGDLTVYAQVAGEKLKLEGAQKLLIIEDFAREAIMKSELMIGKEIIDEEKALAAMRGIQSNVADLMKSVKVKD